MAKPTIEAISAATLPEFAAFLAQNMTVARSSAEWVAALSVDWGFARPNYGFLLRDDGKVVGGIGAYYAERQIRGQLERFCNITSWCVLDAYRQQSMRLAMAVIAQPGYHFSDFSPTAVVGGTLRFLKFKPLDERQAVLLNRPSWSGRVLTAPAAIAATLTGTDLQVYRDHAAFPWLHSVLVLHQGRPCHVIYKSMRFKGLPAARVVYVSDPLVFVDGFGAWARHCLMRGMVSSHVECRVLPRLPWPYGIRSGFNAKLYLSSSMTDSDIDYLYSESVAMDL